MSMVAFVRKRIPQSVRRLTQAASVVALLGLATFAIGLLYPKPLPVIFSMSIGHLLGAIALLLYVVAVVMDSVNPPSPIPRSEGRGPVSSPTPEFDSAPMSSRPSVEVGTSASTKPKKNS